MNSVMPLPGCVCVCDIIDRIDHHMDTHSAHFSLPISLSLSLPLAYTVLFQFNSCYYLLVTAVAIAIAAAVEQLIFYFVKVNGRRQTVMHICTYITPST